MPDDRCLAPQGCGVYPNYVIDRTRPTRFSNAQLAAAVQLIPSGSQVHVIDDGYVDVTPGYVDGQDVTHFVPNATRGGKRFIHIRFCYPPGPPHNGRCVEGWTESPNLIVVEYEAFKRAEAERLKHEAFAFSDIWDTVRSVVTDDTFWLILGSFVSAGAAGWLTGILTAAQQTAVQEGMKSLSTVVVGGVTCLAAAKNKEAANRCVDAATKANFFSAWQAQLVWRMKRAVELGAPATASELAPKTIALANSLPYAAEVKSAYGAVRGAYLEGKKIYDTIEKEKAAVLAKLEEACKLRSPLALQAQECRPDLLALAANFHLGENYFDTSDWNITTGRPVTTADFLPKTTAALRIPDLEKAYRGALRPESGVPRAVTLQLGQMLTKAYQGEQKLRDLGIKPNPDATTTFTKIAYVKSPSSGEIVPIGSAAAAPRVGTFGDLLTAAVLTSPAWFPLFVLPSLRKFTASRRASKTRKRT